MPLAAIKAKIIWPVFGAALLAGCLSNADRTELSIGYYNVEGNTFAELDRQIQLHGPNVRGVGKALAATNIRMIPDVRYMEILGRCRISRAHIKVDAKVTLPRLTNRKAVRADLARAWDNLEEYARLHEAVHVAIADNYAEAMETALANLPAEDSCSRLEKRAIETAQTLLKAHEVEQYDFDMAEKDRILALRTKSKQVTAQRVSIVPDTD